jgi:myo-inositol-1(or 4)-monophosphatase
VSALDLDALLQTACAAAAAGSEIVAAHLGALKQLRSKAPGDWVSEVDLASEAAIREILTLDSGLPVHGEEAGGARAAVEWLVDPLDGTTNFVHRFDAVGVSIALLADGVPVVGVVAAPFLGRTYWARAGGGAFRDGELISVSARPPEAAIVATGFPFRHKELLPDYFPVLERAFSRFEDIRRVGAASLDLCWTAEGVFDGYFELRLGPWDVAAGGLIVQEAGGLVTDWNGGADGWIETGNIVAGPPIVHEVLLECVRPAE